MQLCGIDEVVLYPNGYKGGIDNMCETEVGDTSTAVRKKAMYPVISGTCKTRELCALLLDSIGCLGI
jgi:hypothetical protein